MGRMRREPWRRQLSTSEMTACLAWVFQCVTLPELGPLESEEPASEAKEELRRPRGLRCSSSLTAHMSDWDNKGDE